MKKISLAIVFFFITGVVQAASLVDGGVHYLLANDSHKIAIIVSGGEALKGVNLDVQIGDGGTLNGGTTTGPTITAVDITGAGTIFYGNNTTASTSSAGNLMWMAETTVSSGTVTGSGTLAYLTINTTGLTAGSTLYYVKLANVAATYSGISGGLTTNLVNATGGTADTNLNTGVIKIVSVHDMVWNAGANGAWTATTWTNSDITPSPNYTANAIVNTNYAVTVSGDQEARSLALSNGGDVTIAADGSLTLYNASTVAAGSILTVNGELINGSSLTINGTLTGNSLVNNGTLTVAGQTSLAELTGAGAITISGSGSLLTVSSYQGGTIAAGAGTGVVFGTAYSSSAPSTVPEPASWALLGLICAFILGRTHFKR